MRSSWEQQKEQKRKFYRTENPYSLDEILFIMNRITSHQSIPKIASLVKRSPSALIFKFLKYRPYLEDGSLDFYSSVDTMEEALDYKKPCNDTTAFDKAIVKHIDKRIFVNLHTFDLSKLNTEAFFED